MNTTLDTWPARSTMVPEYPPNSRYWRTLAQIAARELLATVGQEEYVAIIDNLPEGKTWQEYCDLIEAQQKETGRGS